MQYTRALPLLGAVAALLAGVAAFAQTLPSTVERRPPSWNSGDPNQGPTTIEGDVPGDGSSVQTNHPQSPVSGIVTLHELAHQPPRRAKREVKSAWAARNEGDFQRAIVHFQKAIAIDPAFCAALNDLGTAYLETGQADLAIEQFNKVIAVDPHVARGYSNLAIAYLRKDQYSDAERAARRAVDLDRMDTHSQLTLGISLVLQQKSTAEAVRTLSNAVRDFPCAQFWLAIALLNRGEIAAGKNQLSAYLARGDEAGAKVAASVMSQVELMAQSK